MIRTSKKELNSSSGCWLFLDCSLIWFHRNQLEKMNEEQLIRFDFFMRSHFKKNQIKALIMSSLQPIFKDSNISDEMAIVVGSLAKLYVGELVETGLSLSFPSCRNHLDHLLIATHVLKSDKSEPPGLRRHHIM
jgi:hypothetical protein